MTPVALTIYAVEQVGTNGVVAIHPEDIRGTYEQAHDVMAGRLIFGEQRVVQLIAVGVWMPAVPS